MDPGRATPRAAGRSSPMEAADTGATDLLRFLEERGFEEPARWVEFARRNHFEPVRATWVRACPDCGSPPGSTVGSYVFYSNRARLVECGRCGLVWSDLRLPPETVRSHFERTYKSDRYFHLRGAIFEQVAGLVDALAPPGGRVLDVGGATGQLMRRLKRRRPDLQVAVNDISDEACAAVRRRFGFPTYRGSISELAAMGEAWDVLVLCDVIYYEPELEAIWALLRKGVRPGGAVVIRVPNKLRMMELAQRVRRILPSPGGALAREVRIPFFNPEHLFVFARPFLEAKLLELGYRDVRSRPSRLLGAGLASAATYRALAALGGLTGHRLLATPAMIVTAGRPRGRAAVTR